MKLINDSTLELGVERHGKGRYFKSKFFEAGIVSYAKQGGMVYLITKETIDKFIQTMVGCPVIIRHADVTDANVKELEVGRISRVWFDESDGWYWCEGVITDREAEELITKGWSVSCCYEVTEKDQEGGVWHDIEYDAEILNGDFEHLAIVPNPRYREATILLNSTEDENMLKGLFSAKKKVNNSTDKENEEMTDKKENASVDKRELIDEVGGMLKSWGLDEEKIRTVIGKMEKASYNSSETDKKDNASEYEKEEEEDKINENESDDDSKEEKEEDKKENESDEEEDKKENESDSESKEEKKEEEKDEDKKENGCRNKNSSDFEEVRKLKNSVYEVEVKTGYVPESSRLARGANY